MSKKFVSVVLATLALLMLLVYLVWGVGKEPKADYSWLVSEMTLNQEAREKGMYGFVLIEPQRTHHIGDPIIVRFGVIYDPDIWEIREDMFQTMTPLPSEFEVGDRQVRTGKVKQFSVIDTTLLVQCFLCREGTYSIDIKLGTFLARNKEEGGSTVIPLPYSLSEWKMTFAPLTDSRYRADDTLIRLPSSDESGIRIPFLVLAGIFLAGTAWSMLSYYRMRRGGLIRQIDEEEGSDSVFHRVGKLRESFKQGVDAGDVAHALYRLLLGFSQEPGGNEEVRAILEELGTVYSKEGITREILDELLTRSETLIQQGEV